MEQTAIAAQREEIGFRESIAAEIAKRERARQFAFRRLDLARSMTAAAGGAKGEEEAVTRQLAAFKRELDWHSETEARTRILDQWRPVAQAVWCNVDPNAEAAAVGDVQEAMLAFESWYEKEQGQPFLMLFDHEIEEMPVVEF
jgi:hypothetical protein